MTNALTEAPVDVVRGLYDAFSQGDLPGLLELVDPEVDWSLQVDAPGAELVPMLRNGRGHGAVQAYFAGVADLEFHAFSPHTFHRAGDVVLVEVSMDVSHRTTGKRIRLDEIHHWIVRAGKVVRYRPFVDTASLIDLHRP
jgi:ketosteroid isomerase-like protein